MRIGKDFKLPKVDILMRAGYTRHVPANGGQVYYSKDGKYWIRQMGGYIVPYTPPTTPPPEGD